MKIEELLHFSSKASQSIKDCGFLTVWEGAVRSSKTVASVWAFMLEVIKSPDNRHLMIGRSQSAIMANCIDSDYGLLDLAGGLAKVKRDSQNETYIDIAGKRIDMFGGENISSFKAFRGRTYGMVYMDEANLQHRNTIAECFNRTIASKARKHFMTLNPTIPGHWLYKDYLDKFRDENLPGYKWYHFTLDDNPAISLERKGELEKQYTGIFYKRFILGQRVNAEGGCYPSFTEKNILKTVPANPLFVEIGADIGGTGSATAFSATLYFKPEKGKISICLIEELYDTENRSVESLLSQLEYFIKKIKETYKCADCNIDSAEQLIIRSFRNKVIINVNNSAKTPIIDRIRFLDMFFAVERAFVMEHCKNTIEALQSSVWNTSGGKEERLDDGTNNQDSIDAFEYSWTRRIKDLI